MQSPIDPERLLEYSGWMRGLALQLLGDPHQADDAVQDALIAAMESRRGPSHHPRGWLAGILRNQARMTGRSESRRRTREARVARPEATASVTDSMETFAVHRAVVDAVLVLDSPNREIVVLRYFEECSTREIASRLGLSPGAVRSRLSRSLQSLRASLDAEHGGERSRWAPALAAWAGQAAPPATAIGAGAAVWATGAVVVIIAAILWGLQFLPATDAGKNSGRSSAALALEAPGKAAAPAALPEQGAAPAIGQAGARKTMDPGAPASDAQPTAVSTIQARTIDAFGQPLANVQVSAARVTTTSDADGNVVLRLPQETPYLAGRIQVHFLGPDRALQSTPVEVPLPDSINLGDIVLDPGGSVEGRIVGSAGAPIAGQRVFAGITPEEDSRDTRIARIGGTVTRGTSDAVTAEDGTYRIEGLPLGASVIQAARPGELYHFTDAFLIQTGETTQAPDLLLPPLSAEERWGGTVQGADGKALPGARVCLHTPEGARVAGPVTTDGQGRFAMAAPAGSGGSWDVAHLDYGQLTVPSAQPGSDNVLRFEQVRWVELEVRSKGTLELLDATARLSATDRFMQLRWATKTAIGRLKIAAPERDFAIIVDAAGYRATTLGSYDPVSPPAKVSAWLEPAQVITGTILAANGRPASGAFHSHSVLGPDARPRLDCGLPCSVQPRAEAYGQLSLEGSFRIEIPGPGEYELHIMQSSEAPSLSQRVSIPGSASTDIGTLTLEEPGSISGVLTGDAFQMQGAVLATHADGHLLRASPSPKGEFQFDSLRPGVWHLVPATGGASLTRPSLARPAQDLETYTIEVLVRPGQTSKCSIDGNLAKHSARARTLHGNINLGAGTTQLRRALLRGRSNIAETTIDASGDFALRFPESAGWLELSGELNRAARLTLWTQIALDTDTASWNYTPATGDVELLDLPLAEQIHSAPNLWSPPLSLMRLQAAGGDGVNCSIDIAPGTNSSLLLHGLPEGIYTLRERSAGPSTDPTSIPERLRFQVKPGQQVSVSLAQDR